MTYKEFLESNKHLSEQSREVLKYMLEHGGVITQMDAIRAFNCTRLSARIWDLKNACLNITCALRTKKDVNGRTKRWGEYKLHV